MAAGAGYTDPNGVYIYGEDDLAAPDGQFSELLNKGQRSFASAVGTLVAAAIGSDDTVVNAAASAVQAAVARENLAKLGTVYTKTTTADDYYTGVTVNGRPTVLSIDRRLHLWSEMRPHLADDLSPYTTPAALTAAGIKVVARKIDSRGNVYRHEIHDAAGHVLFGVLDDGSLIVPSGRTPRMEGVFNPAAGRLSPSRLTCNMSAWHATGDSTMQYWSPGMGSDGSTGGPAASLPSRLADALGVPVNNQGMRGDTPDEVVLRAGGIPFPVTLSGGQLPATTATVQATTSATLAWGLGHNFFGYGTLAGVPVRIVRAANGTSFTINRRTAGAAVTVPADTPIVFDGEAFKTNPTLISMGRNAFNIAPMSGNPDPVENVVAAHLKLLRSRPVYRPAFYTLGIPPAPTERRGSTVHAQIIEANRQLAAELKAGYLGWPEYARNGALEDMGLTITADDREDMKAGATPRSLTFADDAHGGPGAGREYHPNDDALAHLAAWIPTQIAPMEGIS